MASLPLPPSLATSSFRKSYIISPFSRKAISQSVLLAQRLGSELADDSLPGVSPLTFRDQTLLVEQEAEAYLLRIMAMYDEDGGELRAQEAGRLFFASNPAAFSGVREVHTQMVLDLGVNGAIECLADQCKFGFTAARCLSAFRDDVDFDRLWELASVGAGKESPGEFVNQPAALPLRRFQRVCGLAVQAHAAKMAAESHALILDNARIPPSLSVVLHHNNISWACHPEKDLGRFCNDDTYHQSGHSLNSEWAKEAADKRWGRSYCPSIVEVVRSFLQFSHDTGVPLALLSIIKDDVSKAFTQIRYSNEAAVLHATTPVPGSTMIQTRAVFGGDDSAQIWDCVGRAIMRLVEKRIAELPTSNAASLKRYVDDIFGLVLPEFQSTIKRIIHEVLCQVLGPSAVNEGKSVPPVNELDLPVRQKDIIGFDFDLVAGTLRPNQKGLHKLFLAFFGIDLDSFVPLKSRQRCASLVQRFAVVMRGMLPFVQPLHDWCTPSKPLQSRLSRFSLCHTTAAVRFCVEIWRVVILTSFRNPSVLNVPLTFVAGLFRTASSLPDYLVQTDASEMGACISIWDSSYSKVLAWIQVLFPWGKDLEEGQEGQLVRSAQNMREYSSYCFALILLHLHPSLKSKDTSILWVGDNSSALNWVQKIKCGSGNPACQRMFLAIMVMEQRSGISLRNTRQILSEDMGDIDSVSRGIFSDLKHLTPQTRVDIDSWRVIPELLEVCNPFVLQDLSDMHDSFVSIGKILASVGPAPRKTRV